MAKKRRKSSRVMTPSPKVAASVLQPYQIAALEVLQISAALGVSIRYAAQLRKLK